MSDCARTNGINSGLGAQVPCRETSDVVALPEAGPLHGVRVVELGGIGPGPHAGMLLSDWGAGVVRVERPLGGTPRRPDLTLRGQRIVELDLKDHVQRDRLLDLVAEADILIEGFRPGVVERLGIGPEVCRVRNPRLVFARMTGWGQTGPLSASAGHDINYLSLSGALHAMGQKDQEPSPPLNLVGDYGGGSVILVAAALAAMYQAQRTGRGQVIDMAIVDGASSLLQLVWSMRAHGSWQPERESNLLDGGAPYYRTYRCRDGGFMAVGAIEPQFYAFLLNGLGLPSSMAESQNHKETWSLTRMRFAEIFATKDRQEWTEIFDGVDACTTPVLSLDEAARHPQVGGRGAIDTESEELQAGIAPRFSSAPHLRPSSAPEHATPLDDVLAEWCVGVERRQAASPTTDLI